MIFAIGDRVSSDSVGALPLIAFAVLTLCAYATALVAGVPLHLFLKSRGGAKWWVYGAIGAALGLLWPVILGLTGGAEISEWFPWRFTVACAISAATAAVAFSIISGSNRARVTGV